MASLAKVTLYLAIIALFFSQLIKYSFEVTLILAALTNIIYLFQIHQLKVKNSYFLVFCLYAIINLSIHFLINGFALTPTLYLIRLIALLSFFIFPPPLDKNMYRLIKLVMLATVTFGLIQYFFFPNVTYFSSLNWDPHLNRAIGPFFDPTFTALMYLFLILIYFKDLNILAFYAYLGLALTYSRTAYLDLALLSTYATLKTKKIFIAACTITIIGITLILLPKPYGEGTKLDRTSSIYAKVENYKIAIKTIRLNPLFGTGYNRLSQTRTDQPSTSHSFSGFDSSLLTIWATTGIIGLTLFTLGLLLFAAQRSWQQNLFLIAILIHSCFANSLLYAPFLFLLALL